YLHVPLTLALMRPLTLAPRRRPPAVGRARIRKQIDSSLIRSRGKEASVKRTAARLLGFVGAAALPLALVGLQQPRAAEWPDIRKSDTLWPLAGLSGPQWPKVPAEALSKPQTVPASPAPVSSSAPKDEAPYAVGSTGEVAAAAAAPSRKSD